MTTTNIITRTIISAAHEHKRIQIEYLTRINKHIRRNIAPYEIKDGYLYATDNKQGTKQICSFILSNIKRAKKLDKKFKPIWEIKL